MLKKINSLLAPSSITAANTAATKKHQPKITISDDKLHSDDASLSAGLPRLVSSANTIKIYVSYDSGRYSTIAIKILSDYILC